MTDPSDTTVVPPAPLVTPAPVAPPEPAPRAPTKRAEEVMRAKVLAEYGLDDEAILEKVQKLKDERDEAARNPSAAALRKELEKTQAALSERDGQIAAAAEREFSLRVGAHAASLVAKGARHATDIADYIGAYATQADDDECPVVRDGDLALPMDDPQFDAKLEAHLRTARAHWFASAQRTGAGTGRGIAPASGIPGASQNPTIAGMIRAAFEGN